MSAVQPQEVAERARGREERAWRDADAVPQRGAVHFQGVDVRRQFHPHEIAARRPRGPRALRKVAGDGLQQFALLQGQRLAELPQVAVEAAFLQVGGDGGLRGRRGGQAGGELVAHDLARVAARGHPAHAIARRQGLGERRTMHHDAVAVEGLGGPRPVLAEIQFAVDVVFDQRHAVPRQEAHERFLFVVRHQAAQGILEGGHEPAGARPMPQDGFFQRLQVDAFARVRGHFDGVQVVALQRLQRGVESGGFHDHRVAGLGHGRQAEVQRVEGAVGDDDVVDRHGQAVGQVAQRDGPAQRGVARAQVVDGAPGIQALDRGRHELRQPAVGQQRGAGERGAERQHVAPQGGVEHLQHVVADVHRMAAGAGAGQAVRFGQFGLRRAQHVVAGTVAGADQPAGLQQVIGLEHRRRAHAAAGAGLPYRRQAVARPQQSRPDRGGDFFCQPFIALHGGSVRVGGFRSTCRWLS
ncbi:hypothetical protein D9M72_112280 [compost metagenome]